MRTKPAPAGGAWDDGSPRKWPDGTPRSYGNGYTHTYVVKTDQWIPHGYELGGEVRPSSLTLKRGFRSTHAFGQVAGTMPGYGREDYRPPGRMKSSTRHYKKRGKAAASAVGGGIRG